MDARATVFADQFQTAVAEGFRERGFHNVKVSLCVPYGQEGFQFRVEATNEPRRGEIDDDLLSEIFNAAAAAISQSNQD